VSPFNLANVVVVVNIRSLVNRLLQATLLLRCRVYMLNSGKLFFPQQSHVNPDDIILDDDENAEEKRRQLEESRLRKTPTDLAFESMKQSIGGLMKWRNQRKKDHRLSDDIVVKEANRRIQGSYSHRSDSSTVRRPDNFRIKNATNTALALFLRENDMASVFTRDKDHVESIIRDTLYEIQIVEACVSSMRLAYNREIKTHVRKFIQLSKTNAKLMQKVMSAMETLVKVKAGVTRIADVRISDFDYLDVFQTSDSLSDTQDEYGYDDNDDEVVAEYHDAGTQPVGTARDVEQQPAHQVDRSERQPSVVSSLNSCVVNEPSVNPPTEDAAVVSTGESTQVVPVDSSQTRKKTKQSMVRPAHHHSSMIHGAISLDTHSLLQAVGIGVGLHTHGQPYGHGGHGQSFIQSHGHSHHPLDLSSMGGGGEVQTVDYKRKKTIDGANISAKHSLKDARGIHGESEPNSARRRTPRKASKKSHRETVVVTDDMGNDRLKDIEVIDEEGTNGCVVLFLHCDLLFLFISAVGSDEEWDPEDNIGAVLQTREDAMKTALDGVAALEQRLVEANRSEAELLSRMESMFIEIATLRLERDELRQDRDTIASSLEETTRDYTNALEETLLLRKACEDSYRSQSAEIDKILKRRDDVDRSVAAAKKANRRNKGTQVCCTHATYFWIKFSIHSS
jgi:regulator of replication initiation timing